MGNIRNITFEGKIYLLSLFGFIITGILAYPYGLHWDSAYTISHIIYDGCPVINNWLGWYFPGLWDILYKVSGIPHILGVYINLLYWISITILFVTLFEKHQKIVYYFCFAWFPGTLLFITNITNNSLMFVTLLLGLAFYSIYRQNSKGSYLVTSILLILQCIFIRREACIISAPLVFLFIFLWKHNYYNQVKSTLLAVAYVIFIFGASLFVEKKCTDNIPSYKYMDALTIVAWQDMTIASFKKDQLLIPKYVFKDSYQDGNEVLNAIKNIENFRESKFNGDLIVHTFDDYVKGGDPYNVQFERADVIDFYLHNLPIVIFHKVNVLERYMNKAYSTLYEFGGDERIYYSAPHPRVEHKMCNLLFRLLGGTIYIYFFLAIMLLWLDWGKRIYYKDKDVRIFLYAIPLISAIATLVCTLTSISVQYRYIYPMWLVTYLLFVYILCTSVTIKRKDT